MGTLEVGQGGFTSTTLHPLGSHFRVLEQANGCMLHKSVHQRLGAHDICQEQCCSSLFDPIIHDEVETGPVAALALKLPQPFLLQLGEPAGEHGCPCLWLCLVVTA